MNLITSAGYVVGVYKQYVTDELADKCYIEVIGTGGKVTTFENNARTEYAYGIGDRAFDVAYTKGFEGNFSFEVILTKDMFSGDATIKEMFEDGMTTGCKTSFDLVIAMKEPCELLNSGNSGIKNFTYVLVGFTSDSMKVVTRSEEYVSVTFDGRFKKVMTLDDYLSEVVGVTPSENYEVIFDTNAVYSTPLVFADVSLSSTSDWGETMLDYVRSFELTFKHNLESIYSIGSYFAKGFQEQKFEGNVDITAYLTPNDYNNLMNAFDYSEYATKFNNSTYYINGYIDITFTVPDEPIVIEYRLNDVKFSNFSASFEDANIVEFKIKAGFRSVTKTT